ncbi:hypothetical protein ACMU_10120 [Actibacterium mucosum KCTC 23349]|uniref:AMP-dependent synthetase n=1 Tax=Actibacterium mucosum KCTC 23349 TaxID=1454373 RepID=A0A037ZJ12_9RHOB|nr:hypothetical protein ACMU_10120 [Actibacterium mucosum KCTC 23349]
MVVFESRFSAVVAGNRTLTSLFLDEMQNRGPAWVIRDGVSGHVLTGDALAMAVPRVAGFLHARGVARGDCVALMLPNSPAFCVIFHALLWAGATVTPVNPAYKPAELSRQMAKSGARLIVAASTETPTAAGIAADDQVLVDLDAGDPLASLVGDPIPEQPAANPALLPFSSGTTGAPKAAQLPPENLVHNLRQTQAMLRVEPHEVTIGFLPFFHIYGLATVMNAFFLAGGRLVTQRRFDAGEMATLIDRHKVKQLFIVPPVATMLIGHPAAAAADLQSVDYVLSAAAPLGPRLQTALEDRLGATVCEGFGMTELSSFSYIAPAHLPRDGSCGLALPGVRTRIVDPETQKDLAAGQVGEMWLAGAQLMTGYKDAPEANADTLVEGAWLRTGDLASIDADGYLFLHGRLKDIAKIRGFQVSPVEVEAVLTAHPGIADAAVIGAAGPMGDEMLFGFVVPQPGAELPAEDDLLAHLSAELSSYKIPRRLLPIDEIPKSPAGKIARHELRARADAWVAQQR